MTCTTQIIDSSIEVSCPDRHVVEALQRYLNHAEHRVSPANHISLKVDRVGGDFLLPTGQRELAPEIAAEAAWTQVNQQLQANLSSWLQITGVCIDHEDKRLLVLGEHEGVRKLLAMHCMCSDLEVPSAAGLCVKDGTAIPFALPIHLSHREFVGFKALTGMPIQAYEDHSELGTRRYAVSPLDFGRQWVIEARKITAVARLTWNPGGWSGLRPYAHPSLQENILESCHLPGANNTAARIALLQSAKALAAATPALDLRLGRLEDAPRLLIDHLRNGSDA